MSKDLTPKQLDILQKQYNMPNIVNTLTIKINDTEEKLVYSEEQRELANHYPRLGMIGFDMLNKCRENGVYNSEQGKALLQTIEDYLNGVEIENKELADNIKAWYEGTFCPGYYMNDNNIEFAQYLKYLISAKPKYF